MSKPTYLVFDTETTGLFRFRDKQTGLAVPADAPGQPRLASFAGIVLDADGQEIERCKHYIRPDGWSIDGTEAGAINGLTDAFLIENGIPVSQLLDAWAAWIDAGLIVAAFNAQFDTKVMRAELRRAGRPDMFEDTANICLMRALNAYGPEGMPVRRGFIKLREACAWFGIALEKAHDAMADAEAAAEILRRLIVDDRVPHPKVHFAKAV